jgi:hypothetical protein
MNKRDLAVETCRLSSNCRSSGPKAAPEYFRIFTQTPKGTWRRYTDALPVASAASTNPLLLSLLKGHGVGFYDLRFFYNFP